MKMNNEISDKKVSKNLIHRLVDALIWVPILLLSIFVFTFYNHLILNLMAVVFSVICGYEIGAMFKAKDKRIDFMLYPFLGGLFPLLTLVSLYHPVLEVYFFPTLTLAFMMILVRQTFVVDERELNSAISRTTGMVFALFYPGLLMSFIIRFANLAEGEAGNLIYAFFLSIVFINDSMAYFFGRALGKRTNSQGFILVSPKKSLVGFAFGILGAILVALFFYYVPSVDIFNGRTVFYAIIMGLICGSATIFGDLFESTLKRSAGFKDSGKFFKGRGGVLDAFDSLLFTAPIFYYFLNFA